MGTTVYAISHSPHKRADTEKLGAQGFICSKEKDWHKPHQFKFDFILNTADATDRFDMSAYLSILAVSGTFHNVGVPDKGLPPMEVQDMVGRGCAISASHIGSREEVQAMLELASTQNIKRYVMSALLCQVNPSHAI